MKNPDLSQKLKELRTRKGYSQEQLADAAQINLRTVQRIESGDTEPRGDTLRRLANALNITPDELMDWAEQEDRGFLVFFNLSALCFIPFPLLGIIVPLALWFLKKDKIKGLNQTGKRLLNFQITWCIIFYLPSAFFLITTVFNIGGVSLATSLMFSLAMASIAFYGINIFHILFSAYRAYRGNADVYRPAIPFLR